MLPLDIRPLLQAAFAAQQAGEFTEAEALCSRILATEPRSLDARMLLGIIAARTDRPAEAVEQFRRVLKSDPNAFMALNWLSKVLREAGQAGEAVGAGERARQLRPKDPDILFNLGLAYLDQGENERALECFDGAIFLRPDHAGYHYSRGVALSRIGSEQGAAAALRRAADISPQPNAYLKLAEVRTSLGETEGAIAAYGEALELDPTLISARLSMARALLDDGRTEDARVQLQLAQETDPQNADVHVQRGLLFQSQGEFDVAELEFDEAIKLRPRQGVAYYGLVSGRRIDEGDRGLVNRMDAIRREKSLSGGEAVHLAFALGKAYDNLGEYETAMQRFDEANELAKKERLKGRPFDLARFQAQVEATIGLFTKEFLVANSSLGSASRKPIFIVGMARSGTTLAEQILSSHRDVGGAGELGFWTRAEETIVNYQTGRLDPTLMGASISEYLELLAKVAPDKPRVTDKNPANLLVLGLIHLAFPDSTLIHTRRHPVDTALSIYMTPMRTPPAFACDRENIVFAYRQYARLMEHWRAVLPGDRFIEIDYEAIVGDREMTTRRLLESCGLEWDEACLHPESNLRTVRTPSFWQVRQPVYATSVGRWEHYEPWLGTFAELL